MEKLTIKELRYKVLMQQGEFAKLFGVSRTTLSFWENGKMKPSFEMRKKINAFAKENGCEIDYKD